MANGKRQTANGKRQTACFCFLLLFFKTVTLVLFFRLEAIDESRKAEPQRSIDSPEV
jgi:hypothetical protein